MLFAKPLSQKFYEGLYTVGVLGRLS